MKTWILILLLLTGAALHPYGSDDGAESQDAVYVTGEYLDTVGDIFDQIHQAAKIKSFDEMIAVMDTLSIQLKSANDASYPRVQGLADLCFVGYPESKRTIFAKLKRIQKSHAKVHKDVEWMLRRYEQHKRMTEHKYDILTNMANEIYLVNGLLLTGCKI